MNKAVEGAFICLMLAMACLPLAIKLCQWAWERFRMWHRHRQIDAFKAMLRSLPQQDSRSSIGQFRRSHTK